MIKLILLTAVLLPFSTQAENKKEIKKIPVEVTTEGFVPNTIEVKPGTNVTLQITRKTDSTCANEVQVPSKNIKKTPLPLNKTVEIALGELKAGEVKFGCGMDMMDSAKILVH